ncbi:MAG: hypothetical protein KME29_31335 [Calothrix sp. FI2-JRJ7]|jgi:hypothetical protein|nr:hypothetical protein [Calothrix sp. FI2-JRJ7]
MNQDEEIQKNIDTLRDICEMYDVNLAKTLRDLNALRKAFNKSERMNLTDFFELCSQALNDDPKGKKAALELRGACIELSEDRNEEAQG